MPIPYVAQEVSPPERPRLRLVPQAEGNERSDPLWYPRLFAHLIDMAAVAGFGIYFTKILALLLVSFHMREIKATGKTAGGLFLETFSYGQMVLALVTLSSVALAYFVLLPFVAGKTFGMGAFGLRVESDSGEAPSLSALALRFVACGFGYATAGLMLLATLRGREGSFLQDRISRTRVVRSE